MQLVGGHLEGELGCFGKLRPRFRGAPRVECFDLAHVQTPHEHDPGVREAQDLAFAIGDDALSALCDVILRAGEIEEMIARILARNEQFFVMLRRIVFCSAFEIRPNPRIGRRATII